MQNQSIIGDRNYKIGGTDLFAGKEQHNLFQQLKVGYIMRLLNTYGLVFRHDFCYSTETYTSHESRICVF